MNAKTSKTKPVVKPVAKPAVKAVTKPVAKANGFKGNAERLARKDLAAFVAEKNGLSKVAADTVVSDVLDAVTAQLKAGGSVALTGFGVFGTRRREARQGKNPKTGEKLKIAARSVPFFRAGKALKDAVVKVK